MEEMMTENFINSILNDAEGGCAGGLIFIGIIFMMILFVMLKENLKSYTEPAKEHLKSCFYRLAENFRNKREQKRLNTAYALVRKDLKHKVNNYQNTVWNALADVYMEN